MNTHRVASYLNGDFPPYYHAPYNILIFCHEAIRISQGRIKDTDLYSLSNLGIRGKDMYHHVLEMLTLEQQIQLSMFCVPEDIYYEIVGDKDPRKIISLHLPMANYYNTSAVMKTANEKETKELIKTSKFEVIPFKTRLGISEESVKLQMARELPEGVDADDVSFLISEIF